MKKLLSILAITIGISTFSTTVISCGSSTKTDIKTTIENKINDSNGDIVKGDNLSLDASDNLTQTTILNTIGLTDNEREYVKISSGTLEENVDSEITYDIYSYPTATIPYKTITSNIKLKKVNESAKEKEWGYNSLEGAINITLYNQKQLLISNMSNNSYISSVDLEFDDGNLGSDGCDGPCTYLATLNNTIYGTTKACGNNSVSWEPSENAPNENGNYYNFNRVSSTGEYDTNFFQVSNNHVYSKWNTYIKDITENDNRYTVCVLEEDSISEGLNSDVTSLNTIWNLDGTLYVGTDAGLYKSTDDGTTYSLVEGTNDLDIKNIIAISTSDGSKMFLNTDSGLYVSTDEENFTLISGTDDKTINKYSLFIDDHDVLYYGVENGGLWSIDLNYSTFTPTQITTDNIKTDSNVKSIVQYYDGTLILLTNNTIEDEEGNPIIDGNLVYLVD